MFSFTKTIYMVDTKAIQYGNLYRTIEKKHYSWGIFLKFNIKYINIIVQTLEIQKHKLSQYGI